MVLGAGLVGISTIIMITMEEVIIIMMEAGATTTIISLVLITTIISLVLSRITIISLVLSLTTTTIFTQRILRITMILTITIILLGALLALRSSSGGRVMIIITISLPPTLNIITPIFSPPRPSQESPPTNPTPIRLHKNLGCPPVLPPTALPHR